MPISLAELDVFLSAMHMFPFRDRAAARVAYREAARCVDYGHASTLTSGLKLPLSFVKAMCPSASLRAELRYFLTKARTSNTDCKRCSAMNRARLPNTQPIPCLSNEAYDRCFMCVWLEVEAEECCLCEQKDVCVMQDVRSRIDEDAGFAADRVTPIGDVAKRPDERSHDANQHTDRPKRKRADEVDLEEQLQTLRRRESKAIAKEKRLKDVLRRLRTTIDDTLEGAD